MRFVRRAAIFVYLYVANVVTSSSLDLEAFDVVDRSAAADPGRDEGVAY